MSSHLEQIAGALRALVSSAGRTQQGVIQVAKDSAGMTDRAQAQRSVGVSVTQLVHQLQAATQKSRSAASGIEQLERQGISFADRLASGGSAGRPNWRHQVGNALIGIETILTFLGSPQTMLVSSPDTTGTQAGEVGGSSLIDRQLSNTGDQQDMDGFLKEESDQAGRVTSPRSGSGRKK